MSLLTLFLLFEMSAYDHREVLKELAHSNYQIPRHSAHPKGFSCGGKKSG